MQVRADDFLIDQAELTRRLGGQMTEETERLAEACLADLRRSAQCAFCYRISSVSAGDGVSRFDFGQIRSRKLSRYLQGAQRAYVFAATIGHGADRVIRAAGSISVFRQYVADAVASAMIESLCDYAQGLLELPTRSRFSPGYGDLPLSAQPQILGFTNAGKEVGITLSDSLLMTPTKSVTAIIRIEDSHE